MSGNLIKHEFHSNENYNLWGGRFECENDQLMKIFNQSLDVDKRLWEDDLIVVF
jgi:argininosuccinate lyase